MEVQCFSETAVSTYHVTTQNLYDYFALYTITLWHVDLLLGNDREIGSYTAAVASQRLCKQRSLLSNGRNRLVARNKGVNGKRCFLRAP
jgi:hypothetical protein